MQKLLGGRSLSPYFLNFYLGSYWQSQENKRNLFEVFAKQRGFDPLVPSNWYPLSIKKDLLPQKVSFVYLFVFVFYFFT